MTEIVLDPGGSNELSLTETDIYSVPDATRVHTGLATYQARIKPKFEDIYPYAQRQNRINVTINGSVQWTGYIIDATENPRQPGTTIRADGIAKRLEETRPDYESLGGSLTITSTPLDTAIDDYWDRTPFDAHTVTSQSTEQVVSSDLLQNGSSNSGFQNDISFADDEPVAIRNGNIELLQCSFITEAENASNTQSTTITDSGGYSNDEAEQLDADGDFVEVTFNPDYTIPDGQYRIAAFTDFDNFDGTVAHKINGTTVRDSTFDGATGSLATRLGKAGVTQGDLSAGTDVTLRIEITDYTSGTYNVDAIWLVDEGGRFSDDFNINIAPSFDSNTASWNGPELFPEEYVIEFDTVPTSYNITSTDLDTGWNDTSNKQRISASNNDGSDYITTSNADSFDKSHGQVGRQAKVRMRLSRFVANSQTTPTQGDGGQLIQSFSHQVDGNNRVVIDELELDKNHFDNLKSLHEYGDFLWTIEHSAESIANMTVRSYQRGDETRPTPDGVDDPVDKTPEVLAGLYFNIVYLQGAKDGNGNRPTAEVKADSAVRTDDDRNDITVHLRDPSVTNQGGAAFRARSFLEFAQTRDQLYGTITIPAVDYVHPGYAYSVDFGDGKADKTLEKISLAEDPQDYEITMEFSVSAGLADQLRQLKRNFRNSQTQI